MSNNNNNQFKPNNNFFTNDEESDEHGNMVRSLFLQHVANQQVQSNHTNQHQQHHFMAPQHQNPIESAGNQQRHQDILSALGMGTNPAVFQQQIDQLQQQETTAKASPEVDILQQHQQHQQLDYNPLLFDSSLSDQNENIDTSAMGSINLMNQLVGLPGSGQNPQLERHTIHQNVTNSMASQLELLMKQQHQDQMFLQQQQHFTENPHQQGLGSIPSTISSALFMPQQDEQPSHMIRGQVVPADLQQLAMQGLVTRPPTQLEASLTLGDVLHQSRGGQTSSLLDQGGVRREQHSSRKLFQPKDAQKSVAELKVIAKRQQAIEPFPEKLHRLLMEVAEAGMDHIISFTQDGNIFEIHNPQRFFSEIVPQYFKQSRLSSFKRQLNLYGFELIADGPFRGGYKHEHFQRDQPELCRRIRRRDIKFNGRIVSNKKGEGAPDFYNMPPITSSDEAKEKHLKTAAKDEGNKQLKE